MELKHNRFIRCSKQMGLLHRVLLFASLILLFVPVQASAQSDDLVHIVRPGENLSRIAARYQINYMVLARYNGLRNPNRLRPGQKLLIPRTSTPSTPAAIATQTSTATATPVVQRVQTPTPTSSAPTSTTGGKASCQNAILYTVRAGDSLYAIAARYGLTIADLRRCNPRNGNVIYVGQRLLIPYTGRRIEPSPPRIQPQNQIIPPTPTPALRLPQAPLPTPLQPAPPAGEAPHH